MSHRVALAFDDGITRFVEVPADQTVAEASYRARINIPMDCRDGVCGTCKAFCESGAVDRGSYLEDALSPEEADAGYVLTCQARPRSDLVLQIPITSAMAKTGAATHEGSIIRLERLSPTTVALAIEIRDREALAFLSGQYVNIAVPGTEESRSYSFSNGPDDRELTFLIKLCPGGVMSEYLDQRARVGDEIRFTGPHGSFFLRDCNDPLLLLAGGTGLAPIESILRALAAGNRDRPVHLIYGATTDDDVVELATIRELATAMPAFTWDYCVADRNTTAANQGYVTGLMTDEHLRAGATAVYLCGPPAMVDAVRGHLDDRCLVPSGFFYEKFALAAAGRGAEPAASPAAPTSPAAPAAPAVGESLIVAAEGRELAGQLVLPESGIDPLAITGTASPDRRRGLGGQELFPSRIGGRSRPLDTGDEPGSGAGRVVGGQEIFPGAALAPLASSVERPATAIGEGGYQIGEEHPSIHESDALFDARRALELGALELVLGRITPAQLRAYRALAQDTVRHVSGDRFVDAAAFTDTNAAFHDYLFGLTGNDHLAQAYRALGVTGHMEQSLRSATWCHPRCTQDHLDIVDAVEAGDRNRARALIAEHADRSKITTRRAMAENASNRRPRFVTPGRFAGKVVVVTGAAQGIGRAVAERAAAEGAQLVLVDRSELVHELAEALLADGAKTVAVEADLEQWSGAEAAVREAQDWQGRVDVLINNVGGAINFKPYVEFTEAEIAAEIHRSLMPTLWCCRAVLPAMVRHGGGVIVNVSSAATRGVHRIPYSAAKGGVNALTASLALEYAEAGVRVVATAPGGTEAPARRISRGTPRTHTEQQRQWFQAHIDQTLDSSLLGRYGTLDEQAAAILFLASEEASYITGSVLPVAGGDLG